MGSPDCGVINVMEARISLNLHCQSTFHTHSIRMLSTMEIGSPVVATQHSLANPNLDEGKDQNWSLAFC